MQHPITVLSKEELENLGINKYLKVLMVEERWIVITTPERGFSSLGHVHFKKINGRYEVEHLAYRNENGYAYQGIWNDRKSCSCGVCAPKGIRSFFELLD